MNNGKQFELNFIRALNNKNYDELNENLKRFISFTFKDSNYDDKITCKKMQSYQKADVVIKIGAVTKYISLKSGSQNSVHVEKIETLIKFLLDNNINKSIIDDLLMYHYGDDTLIGNGNLRYSADELKVKYEKQIYDFNKYVNYSQILDKIIERFLLVGTKTTNRYVDAIYYGDIDIGIWCTSKELLEFCSNNKAMYIKTPHFSVFTYQNWCRNISFSKKSESHRQYIQIKWFTILSDINKIRNYNKSYTKFSSKPHLQKKNTL